MDEKNVLRDRICLDFYSFGKVKHQESQIIIYDMLLTSFT